MNTAAEAQTRKGRAPPVIHVTCTNNGGRHYSYYHFLFGVLLPLARFAASGKGRRRRVLLVRSCGPMDRIFMEARLPGVAVIPDADHRRRAKTMGGGKGVRAVTLAGWDLHPDAGFADYPAEELRAAVALVKKRLKWRRLNAKFRRRAFPRILLIERGAPDPGYRALRKSSASQRRTIGNQEELAAMLASRYGEIRTTRLEHATLAEQVALFGAADIVVAQHGAALSNVAWMRPGTDVIEIDDPRVDHRGDYFGLLAKAMGVERHRATQDGLHGPVDLDRVAAIVDGVLARRRAAAPAAQESDRPGPHPAL